MQVRRIATDRLRESFAEPAIQRRQAVGVGAAGSMEEEVSRGERRGDRGDLLAEKVMVEK